MSLHAQLSPEALARLRAQQKNSTVTSIIISILMVLLIGFILLYLLLPPIDNFSPEITTYQASAETEQENDKPEMTRAVQHKPSAPSSTVSSVIAANTTSPTAVPIPEMDIPDPSTDFGDGDDFGEGWGTGTGNVGGGFGSIPQTMKKRCSKADRMARLSKNGGNEQCEIAVEKALQWLKDTQNEDGSWSNKHKVGMTGLAVLTFLGRCETPNSEQYGDAVTRGIVYLVNNGIKNKGMLTDNIKEKHWPYEHGIATYALGEAATFCTKLNIHIPKLNEITKLAGDFILQNQHKSGSWDYFYDTKGPRGGDTSIALWQIQALKACKHSGLWYDKEFTPVMRKALTYLGKMQHSSGAVGYIAPKPFRHLGFTMTGGGVLAHQMWDQSNSDFVRKGTHYISENAKFAYNTKHSDLYRHYYHAQAMINRGGSDWKNYNNMVRDELLKNQNENGSWKNVGGGKKPIAGAPYFYGDSPVAVHYRTCLAALTLEVYYRFLPATGQAR